MLHYRLRQEKLAKKKFLMPSQQTGNNIQENPKMSDETLSKCLKGVPQTVLILKIF
jgi:hypothetical protein